LKLDCSESDVARMEKFVTLKIRKNLLITWNFHRKLVLLVLFGNIFGVFGAVTPNMVSCENVTQASWPSPVGAVNTCWMQNTVSITIPETSILPRDVSVLGLALGGNKNVFYLPVKVAESFPNLLAYSAGNCSLKEIRSENFQGLTKLKYLRLRYNQIEIIATNTFLDLVNLEILELRK
jgi:Leucine rich repeat